MMSHQQWSIYEKGSSSARTISERMQANEINDEPNSALNEDSSATGGKLDSVGGNLMYNNRADHSYCSSVDRDSDDPDGLSPTSSLKRKSTSDHKGKKIISSPPRLFIEEVELAHSLVMLSSARRIRPIRPIGDLEGPSTSSVVPRPHQRPRKPIRPIGDLEGPSTSSVVPRPHQRPHKPIRPIGDLEGPSTSSAIPRPHQRPHKPIRPIANLEGPSTSSTIPGPHQNPPVPPRRFVCKTCKKSFVSHQALGGHRASHRKVKGCSSGRIEIIEPLDDDAKNEENDRQLSIVVFAETPPKQLVKNKSQLHKCAICHKEFLSGQALGGHMRCHRNDPKPDDYGAAPNNRSNYTLDLNEPAAPMEDFTGIPILPDGPATIYYLQSRECNIENDTKEFEKVANENLEDEAESNLMELEEIVDLKDLNDGDESSTWLQIGIGPNL